MAKKKRPTPSPWENLQMEWDTPPERVRLVTDAQVNFSWPFGDDLAEAMSSLDDAYFRVFLQKAWSLCEREALNRPQSDRSGFLEQQRRRLEGYKTARRAKGR